MTVLYEDNHLLIVNKDTGEIVQPDKTGDPSLEETVKDWIKTTHSKPGNVFLGVTHRLDRPVTGVVVFAKTSKALSRLNALFQEGAVKKTYLALVKQAPPASEGLLEHYLARNEQQNRGYVCGPKTPGAKLAKLTYKVLGKSDAYYLLEINLMTGRHHQIRCQLAAMGCPIKGDLKYGFNRSNPDGGISLHAWRIRFVHPVSGAAIDVKAPIPSKDAVWRFFEPLLTD